MSRPKKNSGDLKATVEDELKKMLAAKSAPDPGRMGLIKVAIGYLAVQVKLEESEYGNWFNDGNTDVHPQGAQPRTSERKGSEPPGADFFPEPGAGGLGSPGTGITQ